MSKLVKSDCTTLVYTYTGTVSHLLDSLETPNSYIRALCQMVPNYPWTWLGTGSQEEYEKAESLPTCKRCLKVITSA